MRDGLKLFLMILAAIVISLICMVKEKSEDVNKVPPPVTVPR